MLLFSTSDFICIGIVASANDGDCQWRDRYFVWFDHRPLRHCIGRTVQSGVPMPLAILLTLLLGALCGLINWINYLYQSAARW